MKQNIDIYRKLQRHLDTMPVGFPATKSGTEIRVLKHIFTPHEAAVATCLTHRHDPLDLIFERAGHLIESKDTLERILDVMEKKGGIELNIRSGRKRYANIPLVVGMYEYQLGRLSPEFVADFDAYMSEISFGVEFISTELPQMRTIPIAKSIRPELSVSTFDKIKLLLEQADPPYAVFECICRKKKKMAGEPCQVTDREETCFAVGSVAEAVLRNTAHVRPSDKTEHENFEKSSTDSGFQINNHALVGTTNNEIVNGPSVENRFQIKMGREISLEEAIAILEKNQNEGLVLQPSNTEKAEFICSCCGCCCGMLGMQKSLPKPLDYWATNFYAVIDLDLCNGCGHCEKRCQVGAITLTKSTRQPIIDLKRCIGCGVCIPTCPKTAITLRKKPKEVRPPNDRDALYDTLGANKKGNLGKLKVAGKFVMDAITTNQLHLLK